MVIWSWITRDQHNIMKTFASLEQSTLLVFDMKYSGSLYSGSAHRFIINTESQAGNKILKCVRVTNVIVVWKPGEVTKSSINSLHCNSPTESIGEKVASVQPSPWDCHQRYSKCGMESFSANQTNCVCCGCQSHKIGNYHPLLEPWSL